MKAIILTRDDDTRVMPLAQSRPIAMFPVLNRPLLHYTFRFLKSIGIHEIGMVLNQRTARIADSFGDGSGLGVRLTYVYEECPQGSAGSLRLLADFLGEEPFMVLPATLFLHGRRLSEDISKAVRGHLENNARVTGIMVMEEKGPIIETVEEESPATLTQYRMFNLGHDRRKMMRFFGIFLFGPGMIPCIPQEDYVDIMEQLLPTLLAQGTRVQVFPLAGQERRTVESMEDYFQLNRRLLMDRAYVLNGARRESVYREILDRVWVGRDVRIAPSAQLIGPLVIGDRCRIESGAQLVGPVVLGSEAIVGKQAFMRESVAWNGVTLGEASRVTHCVLASFGVVGKGEKRSRAVVTAEPLSIGELNLTTWDSAFPPAFEIRIPSVKPLLKRWLFCAGKRAIDLLLSSIAMLFCLPIWLVVGVLIKLDSPGPVLFLQRRCGKGGKDFNMVKFRTMVANADAAQKALTDRKEVDGPVFKIRNDPRVTRLGRFLRRTSLDETPQLINVLKGDMSLVGPRPLSNKEMRYNTVWRDLRIKVKPGITGLWQVNGRSESRFPDWIECDINYVRRQSLVLDFKIMMKTVRAVIKMTGAY